MKAQLLEGSLSQLLSAQRQLVATVATTNETLSTKATVTEVKSCVLRKHYEEVITSLGSELDTKAAAMDLSDTNQRLQV
jgi:hypothetical protein